jgi:hypothetical protein
MILDADGVPSAAMTTIDDLLDGSLVEVSNDTFAS